MKNEKIFILAIAMSALSVPLFSAESPSSLENEKLLAQRNQYNDNSDQAMMSPADCSEMSEDEQDFASQLNDANSKTFCSKMTPMQRQKAMQMTGMRGSSGTKISPDDAVQNVMKNSGMQGGKGQRGSGACPVQ
jgi:hypothetical protein